MRHRTAFSLTGRHPNLLLSTFLVPQVPQKVGTTNEALQQKIKLPSRVGKQNQKPQKEAGRLIQGNSWTPLRAVGALNPHAAELTTQLNFNWWVHL